MPYYNAQNRIIQELSHENKILKFHSLMTKAAYLCNFSDPDRQHYLVLAKQTRMHLKEGKHS